MPECSRHLLRYWVSSSPYGALWRCSYYFTQSPFLTQRPNYSYNFIKCSYGTNNCSKSSFSRYFIKFFHHSHENIFFSIEIILEHMISLLTIQHFKILLMPRIFPVWDFMVGIFAQKAMLNIGWVLSILSCQYL